jgi:hypothetical protein
VPVTDFAISPIRDRRRRDVPLAVLAAVVLASGFALVGAQLHAPDDVPRVTVVNPTAYGLNVSLRSGADSRFDLGWVWDHAQLDLADVADVGQTWTFRFSYAGVDAGEQTTTRADLAANGWRIEVPAFVAERLATAGVGPAFHDGAVGAAG